MTLQNRVTPLGELVATPARGRWTGNRGGRFHDPQAQTLSARRWASRRWICCRLDFKGRRRSVWGEGYTELFFHDEASALAAGHRPCHECRRGNAIAFAAAVQRAFGLDGAPRTDWLDARLHAERLAAVEQRLRVHRDQRLPDGCVIAQASQAFVLHGGLAYPWEGFGWVDRRIERTLLADCRLVTSPTIVGALDAGYRPDIVILPIA